MRTVMQEFAHSREKHERFVRSQEGVTEVALPPYLIKPFAAFAAAMTLHYDSPTTRMEYLQVTTLLDRLNERPIPNWTALIGTQLEPLGVFLKPLSPECTLYAVKMQLASDAGGPRQRFVPVVRDRLLRAPVDVLNEDVLARLAPRLRYTTKAARAAHALTAENTRRNYQMGLPFDLYIKMCEICRTGRSEASKFKLRGHAIHRLRVQVKETAMLPRTFYVLWNSDKSLIVGAPSRVTVESFTHDPS